MLKQILVTIQKWVTRELLRFASQRYFFFELPTILTSTSAFIFSLALSVTSTLAARLFSMLTFTWASILTLSLSAIVTLTFTQPLLSQTVTEFYQGQQFSQLVEKYGDKVKELSRQERHLLAQAYVQLNNIKQAIRVYENLVEGDVKDAPSYRQLAHLYKKENKVTQVIAYLKKAILANAKYEIAYKELADYILEHKPKNLLEVRMIYEDMVEVFGLKIDYQQHICDLAVQEGQHKRAQIECDKALKLDAHNITVNLAMAYLKRDLQEFQESDKMFSALAQKFPEDSRVQRSCGEYFIERKLYSKALPCLEKASTLQPEQWKTLLLTAQAAWEIQNLAVSVSWFEKACALDPKTRFEIKKILQQMPATALIEWRQKFEALVTNCQKPLAKN